MIQTRALTLTLPLLLFVFPFQPTAAQKTAEPGQAPPELAASLARIERDLARMVELLEGFRDQHRVDLLLKRIDLKERRVAPLESRLLTTEEEIQALKTQLSEMEELRERLDRTVEQEVLAGMDMPGSDTRQLVEDVVARLKGLTQRLDAAELKARALSTQLAGDREAIVVLDRALQDLLD